MTKQEINDKISSIFYILKDKVELKSGLSDEETKELYNEIFYLKQQSIK